MRKPRPLLITSAAVAVTAAVGTAGTDTTSRWYRRLDKPSWQPPGPAFGIAWTLLYVLLAGAGTRALRRSEQEDEAGSGSRYLRAYGTNLVLNAGWTWAFFRAKRPALALAEVLVLEASTVDLARRTWRLDRPSGAALLPYAAWVTYATGLTAEIARRNS